MWLLLKIPHYWSTILNHLYNMFNSTKSYSRIYRCIRSHNNITHMNFEQLISSSWVLITNIHNHINVILIDTKCNSNWHILIYSQCFLLLSHWVNADQVVNLTNTNLWILMYDHLTSYKRTLIRLLKMLTWTNLFLFTNFKYDKCEVINQHWV